MKRQQGFTLIELIVVIVILGILAATALPKFADLQADAREAKINGARGAVISAMALSHSLQIASMAATSQTAVAMEGIFIDMVNGYPASQPIVAGHGGIASAAGMASADFASQFNAAASFAVDTGHTGCSFTYTEALATGVAPVVGADPGRAACQ